MRLLLNLVPIKSGGGQQVAMNFIHHIEQFEDIQVVYVVTHGTRVHQLLQERYSERVISINNTLLSRLYFQLLGLTSIVKRFEIQVIYTMFGPGIFSKGVKSVTGCAYSNIFFPEIDFWQKESFLNKIKLKLIDKYRLRSTLQSDAIVFENAAMMNRCCSLYSYPASNTTLILPSISEYGVSTRSADLEARLKQLDESKFHLLMLTGWHSNKNITIVPDVLVALKQQGINDVRFIITVAPDHPNSIQLMEIARSMDVAENIILFSAVAPNEVPELIKSSDALALFSLLESFSNNIIESWYFEKPLFISDEEWSRSICNDAVIYVDRNSPFSIAQKISVYRGDVKLQKETKEFAKLELLKYPDPKEKVALQVEFLRKVWNE